MLPYFSKRWIDHIIKRSQGGSDTLENTRLACPPCHDWADNKGGKNQSSGKPEGRSEAETPAERLGVVG
jgi:5-methylcytosine-specific restriction endonuclease McrA